jgi:hypothetical protein
MNLIGNTYPVALFVLVVSQNFIFVYPRYITYKDIDYNMMVINEAFLHWLPFFIIERNFDNTHYLYISLSFYILVFNKNIITIYTKPLQYLTNTL